MKQRCAGSLAGKQQNEVQTQEHVRGEEMSLADQIIEMTRCGVDDQIIANRLGCHLAYVRAARQRKNVFVGGLDEKTKAMRKLAPIKRRLDEMSAQATSEPAAQINPSLAHALFTKGIDTYDIAKGHGIREAEVVEALMRYREMRDARIHDVADGPARLGASRRELSAVCDVGHRP